METVRVPLTRGLEAIIDAADAPLILANKWFALDSQRGFYAARGTRADGTILMHRVLTAAPRGKVVDHINGDKLDNRRANLRLCTRGENHCNAGPRGNNRSGYRGVSFHRFTGRWQAIVGHRGVAHYVGLFDDPRAAAHARDAAAREIQGEYAWLNFPEAA